MLRVVAYHSEGCTEPGISYMKCVPIEKLSGNEVYYTIFKMLLVKIMLCSKLDCQKVLN